MELLPVGHGINDKYRITALIGRGGMGEIYRAEQLALGRVVALKVLSARSNEKDAAFARRFLREASVCARLAHPNVVTVFDYGEIADRRGAYFIAMEHLVGETLLERLRARGVLSADETVAIALQITRGLAEAHARGLVHRDLKPTNLMLVPDDEAGERVKILDFGLVKDTAADDHDELTREGTFVGSPRYMSPEQVEGSRVDPRADLYALGVVLYQCLTGRVPFDDESSMRVMLAHLARAVPPMATANPAVQVPPALDALVMRLLAKDRAERPPDAAALGHELRALQSSLRLRRTLPARARSPRAQTETAALEPGHSLVATARHTRPSVHPPRPGERRGPTWALTALGAAGIIGLAALRTPPHAAPVAPRATTTASEHPVPDASRPRGQLVLESSPPAAEVLENGRRLGQTPLTLTIAANAQDTRRFTVRHAGYEPYTIVHRPSPSDVRVLADLVPQEQPAPAATAAPMPRASAPARRASANRGAHALTIHPTR